MELTGEQLIPASRQAVWDAINDPEILRQCITGCESVTKTSDTDFEAAVLVKVGPVKARFKGKVTLGDLDPPSSCTISGEAQGGVAAGFGKGSAKVQLVDAQIDGTPGPATRLSYSVNAQVGGKLAQIGARLIDGVAAKMAEDFFTKFNQIVGGPAAGADIASTVAEAAKDIAMAEPISASAAADALQRPAATQPSTPVTGGIPSWLWITGLIAIVCAATVLILRS
ncbi:carbon monoxide dehydrogenase subunit G [Ferrovibrio terrae]|uniref:Carbon monoxide dehydrogenase subunit G n=1 Tax=Ferrovibrio terrae TaxID=2594003 RepID=A0A516H4N5_9PROT|nr:carbon monoxide dehydrogenase subunit G [Ferrovibrio terrae]QDO98738.1 carbon monoxide dehydrogenase subunit G [Ferrovibrio terrae]